MDTSDEGIIARGAGLLQDTLGKKLAPIIDPFGQKFRKKKEKEDEELQEKERVEAAAIEEEKRTVTAAPLGQQTELERRNRRKRAFGLKRGFDQPTLGRTGLLGGERI